MARRVALKGRGVQGHLLSYITCPLRDEGVRKQPVPVMSTVTCTGSFSFDRWLAGADEAMH